MSKATKEVVELPDISEWGIKARGLQLVVDSTDSLSVLNGPVGVDVETDEQDNFVGLAIYDGGGSVLYFTRLDESLKKFLEAAQLIGHNLKADAKWLKGWGVNIRPEQLYYDTMLASYVQNSTRESHGLKDLAKEMLELQYPSYSQIVGKGKAKRTLDKHPVGLVSNYCGTDVLCTMLLRKLFLSSLTQAQTKYLEEIELPTMRLLYEMEQIGITVNVDLLRELDARFESEAEQILKTLRLYVDRQGAEGGEPFNANSPKQVASLLLQPNGVNVASTGKDALQSFESVPLVKKLLRYRELTKLRGTYTTPLTRLAERDSFNRIHTTFSQVHYERSTDSWAGIRTGRLSSSSPNLQNISVRSETGHLLRHCFVAGLHRTLIVADYSQVEWRVAAHLSKDRRMTEILLNDEDIYQAIADKAHKSRRDTKTAVLAMNFGAQGGKIASVLNLPCSDGYKFVDAYRDTFPGFFLWRSRIEQQTEVTTLFGRTISVEEDHLKVPYMIQGSAADIIKVAMLNCKKAGHMPILTIHDEMVFDVPDEALDDVIVAEIKQIMESVIRLDVPLKVSINTGSSWSEAK